jgi:Ca2+-binding RTX toxin-like protein
MNFETLERRRLLSVSVVEGYPGYYEVYGDDSADVISVQFSSIDGSFTVNGATYGGVAYVSIVGNGGDDTIDVGPAPRPVAASINGGSGNDTLLLNCAGGVWGEDGNDVIRINNSFRGEGYGGPGDDRLSVSGESLDARLDGGDGNDWLDASGTRYGLFARGGAGDDTIFGSQGDDQIYGDEGRDLLVGNAGDDVLFGVDHESDRVVGGAGIDTAYVDAAESGVWSVEYVFYF